MKVHPNKALLIEGVEKRKGRFASTLVQAARKVGDSTRFLQTDLESVMEVFHSERDLDKAKEVCPVCRHTEIVEGKARGAGLIYFVPKRTKFWTLKDSLWAPTRGCALGVARFLGSS